jgi:hypothetical protein
MARATLLTLAALAFALVNGFSHLRTQQHWWFEDDPMIFAEIADVQSPLAFFFDPAASEGAVGPNEMAPVLLASFWLDLAFGGRDPGLAHAHSIVVYTLAAAAFLVVALRLLGSWEPALLATFVWCLLPSTIVCVEFLSARHYLIGMVFGLLAFEFAERAMGEFGRRRWLWLGGFVVCAWIAMVSKELFPPALLTLVFLRFAYRRVFAGCGLSIALALAYVAYRFQMTSPGATYRDLPLLSPAELLVFVAKLPYMLMGGAFGYALVLGAAGVLAWQLRRDLSLRVAAAIFAVTLAIAFFTVYPVAMPVSAAWTTLGTWYRTPFLINTLLILMIARAWKEVPSQRLSRGLFVLTVAVAAHGAHMTKKKWDRMKEAQRLEGEFLLGQPDALLFSWVEAFWFLPGVQKLYPEQASARFVSRWPAVSPADRQMLLTTDEIWTLRDGKIQAVDRPSMQKILDSIP